MNIVGAVMKGLKQVLTWGSPIGGGRITQLSGEFLFVDGELRWCHRMKTTNDYVEVDELKKLMGLE